MLSWAVPRGPSYDPAEKRMAVHVEDHPISYNSFEGTIPAKQYGAGNVIIWDRGSWEPVGDATEGMRNGKLVFKLHGQKLAGLWELVRISKPDAKQDQWMLFKKRDEWARPLAEYDVIAALPDSVVENPLGLVEERESRGGAAVRPPERAAPGSSSAGAAQTPDLSRAVAAKVLPAKLAPQLATLSAAAPTGTGWLVEPKFDGYRILARVEDGRVRLFTRNGHDWTAKLKSLAEAVKGLGASRSWLDGEIVILDDKGVPDFNALQNALDNSRSEAIVYFVFDAPYFDGNDLRKVPLASRRALLRRLFDERDAHAGEQAEGDAEGHGDRQARVRYSQDFDAPAAQMLEAACRMGMEGVIAKRVDAPYVSARSDTWLKLKCSLRQEFVICGFTDRSGARGEVGSILLGYHENGKLRHGGSVGTGWDSKTGRSLHRRLAALEVDEPTLDPESVKPGRWSRRAAGSERWVQPTLVAEVEFTEWTADGHIRHPIFRGLRADKPAAHITREEALGPAGTGASGPSASGNGASERPASASGVQPPARRGVARPSRSAIRSGSSILPAACASSTWCITTKASPTGSCRICPAVRYRWCGRPKASAANSSSRSIRRRGCPA